MKNFLLFVFSTLILFISCNDNNPLKVDVSHVEVPQLVINRLEQDLFNMDTSNVPEATKKLQAKYGQFYSIFVGGILNEGELRDSGYVLKIKRFIRERDMRKTYEDCQKVYPDVNELTAGFSDAFQHFKYHFPKKKLPQVVTMVSGYNYSVFPIDSTLAIGLEMYLGSNNDFYKMLGYPRYRTLFMNKENILPDAVGGWMIGEFPYMMNKNDFLSQIIYMGKILYATDALLPDVSDTLKIRYTQSQLDYCIQNEFNVWSYFAAQKILYTTDQAEIMKFTSEGPFTTALSKESGPRIGYWIGWRIVKQYMHNNPTITLEQLMKEKDAQQILSKSKYKPKKP
jgi:hypothetical protein